MSEYGFDHLTDREILILTAKEVSTLAQCSQDHGNRLQALETWRNIIIGGGVVILTGLGICVDIIKGKLRW